MTDLREVLHNIGYTSLKDNGREWSTRPLYRDSDNNTALSINKQTGEFYDFVEGRGGPFELLIEKTTGKPISKKDLALLIPESSLTIRRADVELEYQKVFDKSLLVNLVKDHSYWEGRGISKETLNKFQGGVAVNGRMRNRYVFPIPNFKGDLVGFAGRYLYNSDHSVKWKLLGSKTNWVYPTINLQEILSRKEAVITESIGDALSLYENGVKNVIVAFGVKLSASITSFLIKADVNKIFIALNNDANNNSIGNHAAENFKTSLLGHFDHDQIRIALPKEKNDFGEMSREEIELWKSKNQI